MSPKAPRWSPLAERQPASALARHATAGALRSASAMLARLARRLAAPAARSRSDPRLEFYAEAGAPEGALYLDGQLVGWLQGVKRL
jgi:hypothetical protein